MFFGLQCSTYMEQAIVDVPQIWKKRKSYINTFADCAGNNRGSSLKIEGGGKEIVMTF